MYEYNKKHEKRAMDYTQLQLVIKSISVGTPPTKKYPLAFGQTEYRKSSRNFSRALAGANNRKLFLKTTTNAGEPQTKVSELPNVLQTHSYTAMGTPKPLTKPSLHNRKALYQSPKWKKCKGRILRGLSPKEVIETYRGSIEKVQILGLNIGGFEKEETVSRPLEIQGLLPNQHFLFRAKEQKPPSSKMKMYNGKSGLNIFDLRLSNTQRRNTISPNSIECYNTEPNMKDSNNNNSGESGLKTVEMQIRGEAKYNTMRLSLPLPIKKRLLATKMTNFFSKPKQLGDLKLTSNI